MNIKNIILHVGMHKTGTSSIQVTCCNETNNKILKNSGIIYPRSLGDANHSIPIYSLFTNDPQNYPYIYRNNITENKLFTNNMKTLSNLLNEISDSSCHTLLLSGEDIGLLTESELFKLRHTFDSIFNNPSYKILQYVRNPVNYYTSVYQTLIISDRLIDNFTIQTHSNNDNPFRFRIEPMIEVFGKDNIEIKCFENIIYSNSSLIKDFFNTIGIKSQYIDKIELFRANESISQISADFLKFFRKKYPSGFLKEGKWLNNVKENEFDYIKFMNIKGEKFNIKPSHQIELAQKFYKDAEWLFDKFKINYLSDLDNIINDTKINNKEMKISIETLDSIKEIFEISNMKTKKLFVEFLDLKINKYTNSDLLNLKNELSNLLSSENEIDELKSLTENKNNENKQLLNQNKVLEEQIINLSNENIQLKNVISDILASNRWKIGNKIGDFTSIFNSKDNKYFLEKRMNDAIKKI